MIMEIKDLTLEMLDRLDSCAVYTEEDERAQVEYQRLMYSRVTPTTFGAFGRVGRDFLRERRDLLFAGDDIGKSPAAQEQT